MDDVLKVRMFNSLMKLVEVEPTDDEGMLDMYQKIQRDFHGRELFESESRHHKNSKEYLSNIINDLGAQDKFLKTFIFGLLTSSVLDDKAKPIVTSLAYGYGISVKDESLIIDKSKVKPLVPKGH